MGVAPIKFKTTCTNNNGIYTIKRGPYLERGNENFEPGGDAFVLKCNRKKVPCWVLFVLNCQ
jgi:hypothetical protein